VKGDVGVGLVGAAGVVLGVLDGGDGSQGPLAGLDVVGQVAVVSEVVEVDLKARVGPGAELPGADLVVEGEVGDVDFAAGAELDGKGPEDASVWLDHGFGLHEAFVVVVGRVVEDDVGQPEAVAGDAQFV